MAKVLLLLLLPLATLTYGASILNCGSAANVNLNEVVVTGCDQSQSCIFTKGTLASITLPFTPTFQSSEVTAVVHGIVGGVPIPFPLNNPDACNNSGLTCPLIAGEKYTYTASLPVRSVYPEISLKVKWQLKDGNDKALVCVEIPVKIQK